MGEQDTRRRVASDKTVRSLSKLRGILQRLSTHVEPKQWIIDDVRAAINNLEGVVEVLEQPETVEFQVAAVNIHCVSPEDFVSPENQRRIRDAVAQTLRRACREEPVEEVAPEAPPDKPKSLYEMLDGLGLLGGINSSEPTTRPPQEKVDTWGRWRTKTHINPLLKRRE